MAAVLMMEMTASCKSSSSRIALRNDWKSNMGLSFDQGISGMSCFIPSIALRTGNPPPRGLPDECCRTEESVES
jgi:hypothetical protein